MAVSETEASLHKENDDLKTRIGELEQLLVEHSKLKTLLKEIIEYYCIDQDGNAIVCDNVHEAITLTGSNLKNGHEII